MVVPVAQGDPAGARRRFPLRGSRHGGFRALGQADGRRVVLLRSPLRVGGEAAGGPRPARGDGRGARLGRADRAAPRGRAPGADRAPGDPRHGSVHRQTADDGGVDGVQGLHGAHGGPAGRLPRAGRLQERPRGRGGRGVRGAVPERGLEGGRARVSGADPVRPRRPGGGGGTEHAARAARGHPPHADAVGRLRPGAAAVGRGELRGRDRPSPRRARSRTRATSCRRTKGPRSARSSRSGLPRKTLGDPQPTTA